MQTEVVTLGLPSLVFLQSFTVFLEYFISVSIIYVLIVVTLITYNVYGLLVQRAVSECIGLTLLMACYLMINDDLICLNFLTFSNSIVNDEITICPEVFSSRIVPEQDANPPAVYNIIFFHHIVGITMPDRDTKA